MKIIKQGLSKEELEVKLKAVKRFRCATCGCVFEADKDEYKADNDYCRCVYFCECPNCKNNAFEVTLR